MSWARFDDQYSENPKVQAAGPMAELIDCRAIIYSARYSTDGVLLKSIASYLGRDIRGYKRHIEKLVEVGRWHETETGWIIHDFLKYNPSKAQKEAEAAANRTRQEVYRTRGLADAIKNRDGDQCRYCGQDVNWKDRRGARGAVFEHVIPVTQGGETSFENLVVACRDCNGRKAGRTPKEAGMKLLSPRSYLGSEPRYVGSGREIEKEDELRDAPKTEAPWKKLGMTRAEWNEAGCPEPPRLRAVGNQLERESTA